MNNFEYKLFPIWKITGSEKEHHVEFSPSPNYKQYHMHVSQKNILKVPIKIALLKAVLM